VATEEQLQKVEAILVEFAKCEARLFEVMGMPADSDRTTCAMLKGFIHVRMFESLQKEGCSNPIQMDVNWARAGMNCLLKVAYDFRAVTEVKLVKPVVPTLEGLEPEVLNIPNPVIAVACWLNVVLRSLAIIYLLETESWLFLVRGGAIRGARFSEEVTSDMKREADTLFIILKERFVHRVRSRIPIPERRWHYSLQWPRTTSRYFLHFRYWHVRQKTILRVPSKTPACYAHPQTQTSALSMKYIICRVATCIMTQSHHALFDPEW
jgi:hypothetical protein